MKSLQLNLFLFFFFSFACSRQVRAVKNFDVGVILDNSSWIGNISWSCMAMAVEDFYKDHQNYTTRLVLHPRDVGSNNSLDAASAAIDLLQNVQVQVIVGPQASSQAKFVIQLGEKAQVPIVSFSAKSPSLSSKQSPFFIRTVFNDTVQAKAIASIIKTFGWREVVPVFEDSEYGNGMIPYLSDAFQDVDVRIPYRSSIPLQATNNEMLVELKKLKDMPTRVFVVHMTYRIGFQLLKIAKEAGLMEKEFVWITTYGLTDIVDLQGSSATNVMQGVLGIRPYIPETERRCDFQSRWMKKFNQRNQDGSVIEPSAFGLWAYDTVWMLAMVAQKVEALNFSYFGGNTTSYLELGGLGKSRIGPNIHDLIANINFTGISGTMNIVDGRSESQAFEVINVAGNSKRKIGFWTPALGISSKIDKVNLTFDVAWPGNPKVKPKGWEWPIRGKKLKIAVPKKPGFMEFVNTTRNPLTGYKGYSLEIFEAVMNILPYDAPYEYHVYEDANGEMNGTYDDLLYQLYLNKYDGVVGDMTIIANRSLYVDFTLPYTESGVSMLVPVKDIQKKGPLTFLNPLSTTLWLGSGAFFLLTGFVVWILEHHINDDFRGPPTYQLGTVLYFAFSTVVFAHRQRILRNLSRVVLIIWFFVVLILQSSYTASLSSKLTTEQLQPTLQSMDELVHKGYPVGYLRDSFMPGLLKRLHFKDSQFIPYDSPEDYHEGLSNGTVAAIIDEIPYLKVFLSEYCSKYTMVGRTYKTDGFGFAFPRGSPLVADVSRAILNVTESPKMKDFETILLRNRNCDDPGNTLSSSASLTFTSFCGLFIFTGGASLLALILFLTLFLHKNWSILKGNSQDSITKRIKLLFQLFNEKDTSSYAFQRTEGRHNKIVELQMNRTPASPMDIASSHEYGELTAEDDRESLPPDDEETLGREIASEIPDPPSFAEMLTGEERFYAS